MFSVVIPLYNKEFSVKNTLQSVLNQTWQDFEIVIVNDGSTDQSVKAVEKFTDVRMRLIHQENQGVSAARSHGIKEAKYEWVTFLDGDDLWKENHLETFSRMIEAFPNDKVFCTSHTKSKYKKGYQPESADEYEYEVIDDYFKTVMNHVDFFWTGAVCIHRSVFEKAGVFPIGISRGEDLDLWARIGARYRVVRSKILTVIYRVDAENKLTKQNSVFNTSIVSILKLKNTNGFERKYYKSLIFRRIKRHLRQKDFYGVYKILLRYNFQLLI